MTAPRCARWAVVGLVAVLLVLCGCAPGAGPSNGGDPGEPSSPRPVAPGPAATESASPSATTPPDGSGSDLVVEIHVPLTPAPSRGRDAYPFPWIDQIEEYLAELDGSQGEEYDDGEELDAEYLFFITGAPEADLIQVARRVARLDGVPPGAYALVNTTEGDMGQGRRVELG